jgi:hypothetical protein
MALTLDTLKHKQWFLRLLVFSLVTAMIWVGVSLFRSQQKTAIPEELQKLAIPLNPNINTDVISRVEQKKSFTSEELRSFPVYRVIRLKNGEERVVTEIPAEETSSTAPSPAPSPSVDPSASVVPTITPTPSASSSATSL